jgi:hypothetical protein
MEDSESEQGIQIRTSKTKKKQKGREGERERKEEAEGGRRTFFMCQSEERIVMIRQQQTFDFVQL